MMLAGTFPNLTPIPPHVPTLGLVRRPEKYAAPGALLGGQIYKQRGVSHDRGQQLARMAKGLCKTCGEPAAIDGGGSVEDTCEAHRSAKAKHRAWVLEMRAQGRCETCGDIAERGKRGKTFRGCRVCLDNARAKVDER
jgi:hypothetical protein